MAANSVLGQVDRGLLTALAFALSTGNPSDSMRCIALLYRSDDLRMPRLRSDDNPTLCVCGSSRAIETLYAATCSAAWRGSER